MLIQIIRPQVVPPATITIATRLATNGVQELRFYGNDLSVPTFRNWYGHNPLFYAFDIDLLYRGLIFFGIRPTL